MARRDATGRRGLTDRELAALCQGEIHNSMGYLSGELAEDRREAMEYYLAEPFGNEEDGRSQVITTEVADTVDWILPSLLRIFTSTDRAVKFEPVGPEDEDQADQETDVVNHVFYKENDGFLVLYSWFKDALISKNGIVKAYWSDAEKTSREEYRSLTEVELAELMDDEELEALEQEERVEMVETPFGEMEQTVYDVVFRRTTVNGQMVIEVVPPEEFLISKEANNLDVHSARFVAHRRQYTAAELMEEGYSEDQISKLPYDDFGGAYNDERVARRHLDDESPEWSGDVRDWTMNLIWVTECYLKVDYDGDGIAEIRKVTLGGASATSQSILSNEEVDRYPFYAVTPNILTHKFYGLSIADAVKDLQLIKSTVLRQMLDNLYLSNNEEKIVVEGLVNIDDLLTSRPGGIKRVYGDRVENVQAIQPMQRSFWAGQAFPMLEYLDEVRKDRTGVGDTVQGLDADTLSQANTGVVNRDFDAARMRIEMVARVFAETGVRWLFQGIREALQKHSPRPRAIKLRNEWIQVNPAEWREKRNTSVTVGLGTGNKDQQLLHLYTLWNIQKEIVMTAGANNPLVSMKNLYNTLSKLAENAGLEASSHFSDPEPEDGMQAPQQDPAQNAQMQLIQAQLQLEQAKIQISAKELQLKERELQFKAQMEESKQRNASTTEMAKLERQFASEREKLNVEIKKLTAQLSQAERESVRSAEANRYVAELRAQIEREKMDSENQHKVASHHFERERFEHEGEDYRKQLRQEIAKETTVEKTMMSEKHAAEMREAKEEAERAKKQAEQTTALLERLAQQIESSDKREQARDQENAEKANMILSFLSKEGSDKVKGFVKGYRKVQ